MNIDPYCKSGFLAATRELRNATGMSLTEALQEVIDTLESLTIPTTNSIAYAAPINTLDGFIANNDIIGALKVLRVKGLDLLDARNKINTITNGAY